MPGLAIVVGVRPRPGEHRRARGLRAPHRPVAARRLAHRARRQRYPVRCSTSSTPTRSREHRAGARSSDRRRGCVRSRLPRRLRAAGRTLPARPAACLELAARRRAVRPGRGAPVPHPRGRRTGSTTQVAGSARRSSTLERDARARRRPTASGCSSTSPSDRSPSRRSSIRRPRCRPSTGSTTASGSWRTGAFADGRYVDEDGVMRLIGARRWTGTPTSTSRSTRSASPAPVHRRSRAAWWLPSRTWRRSSRTTAPCVLREQLDHLAPAGGRGGTPEPGRQRAVPPRPRRHRPRGLALICDGVCPHAQPGRGDRTSTQGTPSWLRSAQRSRPPDPSRPTAPARRTETRRRARSRSPTRPGHARPPKAAAVAAAELKRAAGKAPEPATGTGVDAAPVARRGRSRATA